MTKIEMLKVAVGFVASAGISQIVGGIVQNNTTQETALQKGSIYVGKIALGMAINDYIRRMTDAKIDAGVNKYHEMVKELSEAKEANGIS